MIFQRSTLSLALWVLAALTKDIPPRDQSWSTKEVVSNDNETTPNSNITSNASKERDNTDVIQVAITGQNLTSNTTYLAVLNNSSISGGGRLLIETDTSTQHSYLTANCDARILGPTEAAMLEEMLAQVQANLRIVINQAKTGVASKYGFQALFKSQSNRGQVASIFNNIMTAAHANNDPDQAPITPLIICVAPETNDQRVDGMSALYQRCEDDPELRAVQPVNSNIVIFCPSFWQLPGVPPQGTCPKKDAKTNLMVPNKMWLQMNRQATFVHEMVHLYLGHRDGLAKNETYNIGDAVALGEQESMKNPSNYAFFYAGEFDSPREGMGLYRLMVGKAVIAGCRKWPYKPTTEGGADGGF